MATGYYAYINEIDQNSDIVIGRRLLDDITYSMSNTAVVRQGLVALKALLLQEPKKETAEVLSMYGTGEVVIQAMLKHSSEKRIISRGCDLLQRLKGNLYALYMHGAGRVVLDAMQTFPDDADMLAMACGAISNLALFKRNAYKLVEAKAAEIIQRAMVTFPEKIHLQQAAVEALWTLSHALETRERVWKSGAVRSVIAAMIRFPDNAILHEQGCGFFGILDYPYGMMRLGAGTVIIRAMKNDKFVHNGHIMLYCLKALKIYAEIVYNARWLLDRGIISIIKRLVKDPFYKNEPEVLAAGVRAIWKISIYDELKPELTATEELNLFALDMCKDYKHQPAVFAASVAVLSNMAYGDQPTNMLLIACAPQVLIEGWENHKDDPAVVRKCLLCAKNLFNWNFTEAEKYPSVRALTFYALEKFPHNEAIQQGAQEVKLRLNAKEKSSDSKEA